MPAPCTTFRTLIWVINPFEFFHVTSIQATYNAMILHYRMCLSGGKDVHNALLSSVKDLARLFSSYSDEVLVWIFFFVLPVLSIKPCTHVYELFDRLAIFINHVKCTFYLVLLDGSKSIKCINCNVGFYVLFQAKRDELLQFAQGAISGLKINADIARFCLFCWAVEGVCSSIFACPCLHALKTKASFFLIPD